MIPVILDTDPGIDDACAITLALTHPEIDLRLISTVAGNVTVDKTTLNALKLVEFQEQRVPVARGAVRPLLKEYTDASYVHGESGMDGYEFPQVQTEPINLHAVEAIRQEIDQSDEPITLLAVGALTNIALLIRQYPETAKKLKEIIIMGGVLGQGNAHSGAEFNIFTDPHAAEIVFQAGLPLTMIGLDVTHQTYLKSETLAKMKDGSKTGEMLYSLFDFYGEGDVNESIIMHDACVVYYLFNRDRTVMKDYYVEIATEGPAIGSTIADTLGASGHDPNVTVGIQFDVDYFNEWFLEQTKNFK